MPASLPSHHHSDPTSVCQSRHPTHARIKYSQKIPNNVRVNFLLSMASKELLLFFFSILLRAQLRLEESNMEELKRIILCKNIILLN